MVSFMCAKLLYRLPVAMLIMHASIPPLSCVIKSFVILYRSISTQFRAAFFGADALWFYQFFPCYILCAVFSL